MQRQGRGQDGSFLSSMGQMGQGQGQDVDMHSAYASKRSAARQRAEGQEQVLASSTASSGANADTGPDYQDGLYGVD